MTEQTLTILAVFICIAPFFTFFVFTVIMKLLKKTRKTRKRIEAEITATKIRAGKFKANKTQIWLQVKEYDICVHKITEQLHASTQLSGEHEERVIYVDVEYKNQTQEEMSCRPIQWNLFDRQGHSYRHIALGTRQYFKTRHQFREQNIGLGQNLRGWIVFSVPNDAEITILQFKTAYIGTKIANFSVQETIEKDEAIIRGIDRLAIAGKELKILSVAAEAFLEVLPHDNIDRAIIIASEMAGLKLLRAAYTKLHQHESGHVLIGAISDTRYNELYEFIFRWSRFNGLETENLDQIQLASNEKEYIKDITKLETSFDEICKAHNIGIDFQPFLASLTALQLTLADKTTERVNSRKHLATTLYHIALASKTVPFATEENE